MKYYIGLQEIEMKKELNINNIEQNNINLNQTEATTSNINQQNQSKNKSDFSHLFILMRKATKLLSIFDKKIKIFTDKLNN